MCDYSLMEYSNRLANQGEVLLVHRFHSGCLGLASPAEANPPTPKKGFWTTLKDLCWLPVDPPVAAVCIPPGARLILHDIPRPLRKQLGIGAVEEVRFVQLSAREYQHRDAVCFRGGRTLRLQELTVGQRVEVACLGGSAAEEPEFSEHLPARRA